jgi:hypothetical protein
MTPHFLVQEHNLVELAEEELTEADGLQTWIAEHPELLGGAEMEPEDPRRFLLVRREAPIEGLSLDHLFVDQDAIPTFIETKKAQNRQARREVVAQMLDYAAEASAGWSGDKLEEWLAQRCEEAGLEPEEELSAIEPGPESASEFWQRAEENLRAGNVRLIFACDRILPSLQRVIEFLNERMDPTEVLALEVRRLQAPGQELFHSRLVGATERARAIKGKARKGDVIPALVEAGVLADGADLWVLPNKLPVNPKPHADDPRLRVTLKLNGGTPSVIHELPDSAPEELPPSRAFDAVRRQIDPAFEGDRYRGVHSRFALEPGGKSLGTLAREVGAWSE